MACFDIIKKSIYLTHSIKSVQQKKFELPIIDSGCWHYLINMIYLYTSYFSSSFKLCCMTIQKKLCCMSKYWGPIHKKCQKKRLFLYHVPCATKHAYVTNRHLLLITNLMIIIMDKALYNKKKKKRL